MPDPAMPSLLADQPRAAVAAAAAPDAKGKPKKAKKRKEAGRGVETMFRTSYGMHVDMSALADSKANIMISINGLMISIILAAISPKIETHPWLLLPTAVVLLGCLVSLTFAILAARPRINAAPAGQPRGPANLMFFGSFVSLSAAEYERGVTELMEDPQRLYQSMARDIFGLGKVLERKFNLLRSAYTVFLVSLVSGVLLYLIVYLGVAFAAPTPVLPVP